MGYQGRLVRCTEFLIAVDPELTSSCPDYDALVWREACFTLLPSVRDLVKALGEDDTIAEWLGQILGEGRIETSDLPLLKATLVESGHENCDPLIAALVIPPERFFDGNELVRREN